MSSTTTTPQGLQCDRVALTVTDEADEVIEQAIAIATPLHKLRAGDRVLVAGGEVATVKCVVELYYEGPMVHFAQGLHITATHPIRVNGKWRRPHQFLSPTAAADAAAEAAAEAAAKPTDDELMKKKDVTTISHILTAGLHDASAAELCPSSPQTVYNVVLDRNHVLLVDGIECVTWGHDLQEQGVAHPFYGTRSVVEALSGMVGWSDGFIRAQDSVPLLACREKMRQQQQQADQADQAEPMDRKASAADDHVRDHAGIAAQ